MGTLIVKVANAYRQPLPDRMDVKVVSARSDALVRSANDIDGRAEVRLEGLIDHQPYIIKVFPRRHRPVAAFGIPMPGDPVVVQLHAPLDPEHVEDPRFPPYDEVPEPLRQVLEASTVEDVAGHGHRLYDALTHTQRAGMFNLYAKMSTFGFDEQRTIWSFVERLYRIRADRVFADVKPGLRDLVKGAVAEERFREVSGKLHKPPDGFEACGSFKTHERYGNLQLSFFVSTCAPLAFKVDADIDDAAGLGHAFQVIRNFITKGTTHPYDIHEILVFRQEVTLPYRLA
jgi:hypothetical protein